MEPPCPENYRSFITADIFHRAKPPLRDEQKYFANKLREHNCLDSKEGFASLVIPDHRVALLIIIRFVEEQTSYKPCLFCFSSAMAETRSA